MKTKNPFAFRPLVKFAFERNSPYYTLTLIIPIVTLTLLAPIGLIIPGKFSIFSTTTDHFQSIREKNWVSKSHFCSQLSSTSITYRIIFRFSIQLAKRQTF